MAKKLFSMMVLALFVAVAATSCDKKKEEEKTEPAKKEAAATEEKGEEAKAEEGGGGDACAQYAKCCKDYVDALSKLENVPAASVDAAKKGCAQIDTIKDQPGAENACKAGMEAMQKAAAAFKGAGLEVPASCK